MNKKNYFSEKKKQVLKYYNLWREWYKFFEDFGKHDYELDRWFDINLCFNALYIMIKQKPKIEL